MRCAGVVNSVMSRAKLLLVQALLAAATIFVNAEDAPVPKPKKILDINMNPAYIPAEEKHASFWRKGAASTLQMKLDAKPNTNKAKNGILFIGDGMSLATVMAARTFAGQLDRGVGEDTVLAFEKFPVSGLARTYCLDAQVPDSACTATSYLTGVKTRYGAIGLDGNVTRGSCYSQLHHANLVSSIGQWALDQGLDAGIVTSTRVTHASPAGMYAHTSERNWESDADVPDECLALGCKDIAYQLVMENPGKLFKVIMGGGRRELTPNISSPLFKSGGRRLDNLDLTEAWHVDKLNKNATHQYVTDRSELMKVSNSEELPEYLLGLFQDDHMDYHLQAKNQPTLEEMVEVAIKMLSRNPKGYFLFVEGGRIDHAHHDSLAHLAMDETVEYAKAVERARSLTSRDDTLIVVSADHAHTMTVAGYPSRGNDILGTVDTSTADDSIPYTTISYANGKGVSIGVDGKRIDVTKDQSFLMRNLDYAYPGLVPLDSETHGGEDVAVFALGPWQHLFTASYEQSVLPHLMAYAMCIGDQKHENCKPQSGITSLWSPNLGVTVSNSEELPEYLLGLFQDDHMDYHLQAKNQPTLEEMVEVAIKMLSRNPKGYFLFVEGGRIDHAHHDSLAHLAMDETVEYAKAVERARSLTSRDDTLIVVSADHAHTMTVAGYPSRGNDILGTVDTSTADDSIPYTTISYANGKGVSIGVDGKRIDVTKDQSFLMRNLDYAYPGLVPLDSETHGGEDVAVFALGPWQHLFTASYEQSVLPHLMAYAMCIGDQKHENCKPQSGITSLWSPNLGVTVSSSFPFVVLAVMVTLSLL